MNPTHTASVGLQELLGRTHFPDKINGRATAEVARQPLAGLDGEALALAAWLWLQSRWCGQTDLVIDLLHDDGTIRRARFDIDPSQSVASWVRGVRQRIDSADGDDSAMAGDQVVSEWVVGWRRSSSPLSAEPANQPWLVIGYQIDSGTLGAAYDASTVEPNALQSALDVVAWVIGDWAQLLRKDRIVADPISRWSAISPSQQVWIDMMRAGPAVQIDDDSDVVSLFQERVRCNPDVPAVEAGGVSLSYSELSEAAALLAKRLQDAGVGDGDRIALDLDRGIEAIVAMVAAMMVGAAYVPLDRRMPSEFRTSMLDDAAVGWLLAYDTDWRIEARALSAGLLSEKVRDSDTVGAAANRIAYVMYTSGSTGRAKAIPIRHRSILRLVIGCTYVCFDVNTRMLAAAPLGFDASTLEIWGPLLNGGCCVIHLPLIPSAADLFATLERGHVDTAWLTASLFNAVVDDDVHVLGPLKCLLIGGEALSVDHVRRAQEALPHLQLINGYGPTETTTFATTQSISRPLSPDCASIPIGRPITNTWAFVLSDNGELLPPGMVGELYLAGDGLSPGYLGAAATTSQERFVPNPFDVGGSTLYRTGDRVRWLSDGSLDYCGRIDTQVKIRGFRVELTAIETVLGSHPEISACAVQVYRMPSGQARLHASVVLRPGPGRVELSDIRRWAADRLPQYMVPNGWAKLDALPLTVNGKIDRRRLPPPAMDRPAELGPCVPPSTESERIVAEVFSSLLSTSPIGRDDNVFDLGADSLLIVRAQEALNRRGPSVLSVAAFFSDPTIRGIAQSWSGDSAADRARPVRAVSRSMAEEPVAIVGMAGRFPGADSVEEFWRNLCNGRDSVRTFGPNELDPSIPASLKYDSSYVPARGVLDNVAMFDAEFFGISPNEAELIDPQQRLFLELCWECIERAGHAPDATDQVIGVFAGMFHPTYLRHHVMAHPDKVDRIGEFQVSLGNEKDYIATRVAHRLNLRGPAVSVHTACSTSLVAIAQAVDSLRSGHCTMALAGGSSITCPPDSGYLYQEGSMLSPDGCTRAFDACSAGTVFSDASAVVLLKPLSRALSDGNPIYALIRGAAVNNDGGHKASFTAPSVDGQRVVIEAALDRAGVDARSISYVEAHGTATPLGDPVEIEALTRAYRRDTSDVGFCGIGSVKTNIGHSVIAAGATGVIKTALALQHQQIPPSLHFKSPNPRLTLEQSPFRVVDHLTDWIRSAEPRRAGVSSFGVGGTNAHVILEEAPLLEPSSPYEGPQTILLSARSATALGRYAASLAAHLRNEPHVNLADLAFTLERGRTPFGWRAALTAGNVAELIGELDLLHAAAPAEPRTSPGERIALSQVATAGEAQIWLFPGQGAQYPGMGSGLYRHSGAFMRALDQALEAVGPHSKADLRRLMFDEAAVADINLTVNTQPALFCIEYAIGCSWLALGLKPAAFVGHSVGEFAAAVLAGVMSLEDAARLVAVRGALMQSMPAGSMLSVSRSASDVAAVLPDGLDVAAVNSPRNTVVAGPTDLIEAFAATLAGRGIAARVLRTSHAFHSSMMQAACSPFESLVRAVRLAPPNIPIVSCLTGAPLSDEALDPAYWSRHMRAPVLFSSALQAARAIHPQAALLEVGPRDTLCALARQHGAQVTTVASLENAPATEAAAFSHAVGRLWAMGSPVRPTETQDSAVRRRLLLPTYPFERKRYWLDAKSPAIGGSDMSSRAHLTNDNTMTQETHPQHAEALAAVDASVSRRSALRESLVELFEDISGLSLNAVDGSQSFVALGFDSLTLTQAALQLKKRFPVIVTFRQLMEQLSTFDSLAEYLASALPPDASTPGEALSSATSAVAEAVVPPPPSESSAAMTPPRASALTTPEAAVSLPSATPTQPSALRELIAQQLQLMSQQLALLNGTAGVTLTAAASAVAAPPTAEPSSRPTAPTAVPATSSVAAPVTSPSAVEEGGRTGYDVKRAFGAIARIHQDEQQLTARQRTRLDALVRRYCDRTAKSKAYTQRHRSHLADPRVVNGFRPLTKEMTYQIVIDRSKAAHLWDIDGNQYVDALNGFGMNLFGWQPPFVLDAVRAQLEAGYEIGPQHPLAGEVAELICELTGFDRVGLCNTGSEAVMAAIRIARTVTGRDTIVMFSGSYHGTFDEVVVRAGRQNRGLPAAPGILPGMFGDVRVLEYGAPESLEFIERHANDLAAVLVEPVQSRRPDLQPREFLVRVREITARCGACLVFDEVITGFRAHLRGAQAIFGIRADLATYGKVIGGGYPVGVVAGRRQFMDALDGGHWSFGDASRPTVGVTYFAGTFVRHPLALAACKASLLHLKRQGEALQAGLNLSTAAMTDELNAFCRASGAPVAVNYFSSLWRIVMQEEHPLQDLLYPMMRARGVHILDNFPCFLTTSHSPDDIAVIKTAFKESLAELQEAGFLPAREAEATLADASRPPLPNAKLGRDKDGSPAWFIPNPDAPGKYKRVS